MTARTKWESTLLLPPGRGGCKSVCHRLGIPTHTFNFTGDFDREVIAPFIRSYEQGRTPNPRIDCNRYLKFQRLYHRALELGCDYIATGHYVRGWRKRTEPSPFTRPRMRTRSRATSSTI